VAKASNATAASATCSTFHSVMVIICRHLSLGGAS
jgi:hypothetical protein